MPNVHDKYFRQLVYRYSLPAGILNTDSKAKQYENYSKTILRLVWGYNEIVMGSGCWGLIGDSWLITVFFWFVHSLS